MPNSAHSAFSATALSSRGAYPCTCSASTGRPSPSRASLRWIACWSPSDRIPLRSGWLIVGRSSSSAENGVPGGSLRPGIGENRTTMSAAARCGRMYAAESGSRRPSSASTCSAV